MQLTKPVIAGSASGLLLAGAILGNVLLGSVAAAGPAPGPTPSPTATRSTTIVASKPAVTSGPGSAINPTATDTTNVQSGAQSGAQVEDNTPDTAGAAGAKETPEAAGQEADLSTPSTPPTVTQAAAIKAALAAVPGAQSTPAKVKLDDENGQPVYHILLTTSTGPQMVKVNGLTGVARVSHDTGADAEAHHAPESPGAN